MASSIIRLICPNLKCRAILSAPESARGKSVRCRNCGQKVRVGGGGPALRPLTPTPAATPAEAVVEADPTTADGNKQAADPAA